MKKVSIFNFLIAFYFCITPFNSIGSEDFDVGIYDATFSVIEELKNKNQLENRRLAVYGFRNSKMDQGCKQLSYVLANKIIDSISKLKRILDISFSVVSRSDLEALETELGLFNKLGNYKLDSRKF